MKLINQKFVLDLLASGKLVVDLDAKTYLAGRKPPINLIIGAIVNGQRRQYD